MPRFIITPSAAPSMPRWPRPRADNTLPPTPSVLMRMPAAVKRASRLGAAASAFAASAAFCAVVAVCSPRPLSASVILPWLSRAVIASLAGSTMPRSPSRL